MSEVNVCEKCGVAEYLTSEHCCLVPAEKACECGEERPTGKLRCDSCQELYDMEPQTEVGFPDERLACCPHCSGVIDDGLHEVYCSKEEKGARVPEEVRDTLVQARARILSLERMAQRLVQANAVFPSGMMFIDSMLKEFEHLATDLEKHT